MAVCNPTTLESDGIANGFEGLDAEYAQAVELQMLYQLSGSTMTMAQLEAAACANGFDCLDNGDAENIELQLWCEILGGT